MILNIEIFYSDDKMCTGTFSKFYFAYEPHELNMKVDLFRTDSFEI